MVISHDEDAPYERTSRSLAGVFHSLFGVGVDIRCTSCRSDGALAWSRRLGVVVFLQDSFVDAASAKVSLFDRGYLLGEGAFATMRAYRGRCFRSDRHLAQLAETAAAFGIALPFDRARIAALADDAAARTGADAARVRVTLSDRTFSVIAEPAALPSADDYAHGVAARIVSARRIPPACFDGSAKTLSYAPQMLAQRTVHDAAEGLQLALDGSLACGVTSNLFAVVGDELVTPPLDTGCRAGVTRECVLALGRECGLRAVERRLAVAELWPDSAGARPAEAFLTNTRIELLPLREIDGRALHPPDRTRALHVAFRALVERELESVAGAARR